MRTRNSINGWLAPAASIVMAGMVGACSPQASAESADTEATASAASADTALAAALEQVRAATSRFQDVNVALAEGYILPMDLCDTAEMMGRPAEWGAMGLHYARPDLLGITGPPNPRVTGTGTHTDFSQPAILIYEPQADGSLQLVAVENLVFIDAWKKAGNTAPPTFHGVEFDLMQDDSTTTIDEAHMFEPHYDLHVWLYRDNPRGTFAQFNPNVTCAHHQGAATHGH